MAAKPGPTAFPIWVDDYTSVAPNPMVRRTTKLTFEKQTGNTVAANQPNCGIGVVAVPAITAGAVSSVTLSDSLIGTNSIIFLTYKSGTTVAAATAFLGAPWHDAPAPGSVVIHFINRGAANILSTDYVVEYWVGN